MRNSIRYGRTLTLCVVLALAACGKNDQAERQKQADELQKGIESYLATAEGPGQAAGLHHDKVAVAPTDAGDFQVTLSGVVFGEPKTTHLEIGTIAYRLAPKDNGDYTASQLSLAPEMPIVGADGKPIGSLKLEPGTFQAEWSKALNSYLTMDWQIKNLVVHGDGAEGGDASAQSLGMKIDTADKGNGIVDQSATFDMEGFSAAAGSAGGKFTVTKLTGGGSLSGVDMAAYQAGIVKLRTTAQKIAAATEAQRQAQAASGNSQADASGAPEVAAPIAVSDDDRKQIAELVRQLPKVMSGFAYSVNVAGVAGAEAGDSDGFRLAHAALAIGVKNLNTDKSELDFEIKHDGLALAGEAKDPVMKAMLPRSGNLALALTDVPTPALVDAIAQSLPSMMTGDESSMQSGMFMLMGSMTALLQQSDLKLKINPSGLATEQAHVTAEGDLKVAPQSPFMATGTVNAALTGLDDLVAALNSLTAAQPDVAMALGALQSLKGYADRGNGADGKPVDKFKLDLTPDGQLLVNGKPLEGL